MVGWETGGGKLRMRTFVKKEDPTHQTASANFAKPTQAFRGENPGPRRRTLQSHHTHGHQAEQGTLWANHGPQKTISTGGTSAELAYHFKGIPIQNQPFIQIGEKLTVSIPTDPFEREADRIAQHVVRTPEPQLKQNCACGAECPDGGTSPTPHGHERLQTDRAHTNNAARSRVAPMFQNLLHSPGRPLDDATRDFMELRFGYRFDQVRVHNDARADEAARGVNAKAFTIGRDIFFASGYHAFKTEKKRSLLAHELTHTIQQNNASTLPLEPNISVPRIHVEQHTNPSVQLIQRGEELLPPERSGVDSLGVDVRERYVQIVEEKIAEIQQAVANGCVWPFEDEDLLLGSEMLEVGVEGLQPPEETSIMNQLQGRSTTAGATIERRLNLFGEIICALRLLVSRLQSGAPIRRQPTTPGFDWDEVLAMYEDLFSEPVTWVDWLLPSPAYPNQFAGIADFFTESPSTTPVLRPAQLPGCGPEPSAERLEPERGLSALPIQNTGLWVVIPNPERQPTRVSGILQTRLSAAFGSSFELWRQGDQVFYFREGQRIFLPNLTREFPSVLE